MALSRGARLGAYEIVAALGAGGMGEVYRARDLKLQRDAAIKVLPIDVESEPQAAERLRREARHVTGTASSAAISPDGRYLVRVVADHGFSLWLRQTRTGSDVRIVPADQRPFVGLAFSRDGDFVYFTRFDSRSGANVDRISVLGGEPRLVGSRHLEAHPAGGPPQRMLDMNGDRIVNFDWSADGRLAVAHGKALTDVVMFSGLQ